MDLFLSPLISAVVDKATDSLIGNICRLWGLEERHKKLRRQLLAIQTKIEDAELQGVDNPAVQEWTKQLDAAAHEAMDVLDDFQYESLRRNAISQHPSASAMVIKSYTHTLSLSVTARLQDHLLRRNRKHRSLT
jgi:Rx N-terminal domain